MTCRIDRLATDNDSVILRISGRMTAGALDLLRSALAEGNRIGTIDLKDLRQVNREAVKLLALSEASGIELRNCPAYVREWIDRERAPSVFIVAEDDYVRRSLEQLITTTGFDVTRCGSAEELLSISRPAVPCCLLLDVSLPGTNGLELQRKVGARMDMPIVFITGRPDVRVTVEAMKAGAVDVLVEPVNREQLLSAVDIAIELSRATLLRDAALRQLRDCYASLTHREREVMRLVVSGGLNKQVGFELGITERTVKEHRGKVMRKMKADSLPDLVRMAARLNVAHPHTTTEFM